MAFCTLHQANAKYSMPLPASEIIARLMKLAGGCSATRSVMSARVQRCNTSSLIYLRPSTTPRSFPRARVRQGAQERYGLITERIRRQLEHELGLIEKLGLAGYFLIVWDIVRFCRENNILVQGRGSAANSAVCYA